LISVKTIAKIQNIKFSMHEILHAFW